MVTDFKKAPFVFESEELKSACKRFVNSKEFEKIRTLGNDLPRFMMTKYSSNFNKEHPIFQDRGDRSASRDGVRRQVELLKAA